MTSSDVTRYFGKPQEKAPLTSSSTRRKTNLLSALGIAGILTYSASTFDDYTSRITQNTQMSNSITTHQTTDLSGQITVQTYDVGRTSRTKVIVQTSELECRVDQEGDLWVSPELFERADVFVNNVLVAKEDAQHTKGITACHNLAANHGYRSIEEVCPANNTNPLCEYWTNK